MRICTATNAFFKHTGCPISFTISSLSYFNKSEARRIKHTILPEDKVFPIDYTIVWQASIQVPVVKIEVECTRQINTVTIYIYPYTKKSSVPFTLLYSKQVLVSKIWIGFPYLIFFSFPILKFNRQLLLFPILF